MTIRNLYWSAASCGAALGLCLTLSGGAQAAKSCLTVFGGVSSGGGVPVGETCSINIPNYGTLTGSLQSYAFDNSRGLYTAVINVAGVGAANVTFNPGEGKPTGLSVDGCAFTAGVNVGKVAGTLRGTITPLRGASCSAPLSSNPAPKTADLTGAGAGAQLSVLMDVQSSVLDMMVRGSGGDGRRSSGGGSGARQGPAFSPAAACARSATTATGRTGPIRPFPERPSTVRTARPSPPLSQRCPTRCWEGRSSWGCSRATRGPGWG